ncbi:hypothetical protein T265_04053 [Opisthorchis viverrini]|uniref:Rap-GAP domain-containing protein n=1 Tax=Opisthorchis viverrini TaxID=6198 RepID=A0A074ZPF6_OPIVI|nr:hypothetical protein T265_04053 [Opisthorchis viverrini]KER29308.1 hypothetical protein T265_04053 [Opisthorchis viverrini]
MDRVFRRHKASEGSVEKSQRKFLADKESSQKLKHLRILIGQLPSTELQNFFVENRSYIFHIFTDSFGSVEQELRQKVSPTNLKELENVLVVFEKILLLLPEYIREKWQYNGIMDVLDQLLNERNAVSVRKFGIRLFLLWYQILADKATPKCHKMFTSLVPNFGFWISEYQKRSKPDASGSISGTGKKNAIPPVTSQPKANFGISPGDNGALVPSVQVEEQQSNQDLEQTLLQHFLSSLVSEVAKVSWREQQQEKHLMQLWFLFEQLKRTYLPVVFPCLSPTYTIYEPFDPKPLEPSPGLLDSLQDYPISPTLLPIYQEIFVLWLTPFIHPNPRSCGSDFNDPSEARDSISRGAKFGSSTEDSIMPPAVGDTRPFGIEVSSGTQTLSSDLTIQGSNEARKSLSGGLLQPSDQTTGLHSSSVDRSQTLHREKPQIGLKEVAMLCAVLYGCRQNINLLHDILQHAFLLPIQCYHALRAVVNVYSSWLEDKANRPIFLQSIESTFSPQKSKARLLEHSFSAEDKGHEGDDEAEDPKEPTPSSKAALNATHPKIGKPLPSVDVKQGVVLEMAGRSDSDSSSPVVIGRDGPLGVNDSRRKLQTNMSNEELRGRLQTTTQIMLYNMARVFLLKCPPAVKTHQADPTGKHSNRTVDYVKEQVDLCRRILYIFRVTSDRNELTSDSWMKLLSFLLEMINSTMIGVVPNGNIGDSWLSNEKLVHTLFQTMNGALLRASLLARITQDPWNQCLTVYSKLTHWTPLISEWKKVMQSLTTIMAKLVYGVDLSDLPTGNLPRRGKRDLGHHSTNRARPKSFTDSTLAHVPSTNVFQPGAQGPISPQPLSADPTFSEATVSISGIDVLRKPCDMYHADGCSEPLSPASPTQTPEGHFSSTTDAGISPSVIVSNHDTRPTNRVDSEGKLPKMDSSRHHSLPRTLEQAHRSTTLVPSRESTVFAMRRSASNLNEPASVHSIHDPTYGMADQFSRCLRTSMSDGEHLPRRVASGLSPDARSVLSVGSPTNRRLRRSSLQGVVDTGVTKSGSQQSLRFSLEEPQSPPPDRPALDDDSSSALSRNDFGLSDRASLDGGSVFKPKTYSASPDVKIGEESPASIQLDGSLRGTYSPSLQHRAGTLRATSAELGIDVDLTQTPTKSSFETQNVPRCILAGGEAPGWTQESIVVCWRRFLGMLGNVNDIENNTNLEKVYTYLSELVGVLLKIQQHQKLNPVSDACVQPLAEYCVPIEYVLVLRDKSPSIRLSALSTLCECVIRPPDRPVNYELIAQFYRILHRYLTGTDERYVHGIVRSCGMRFFAADLPGSHLLLLDFLRGINIVLTDTSNAKEVPRTEAVVMLSTLLCYPIHFNSLECFDATLSSTVQLTTCTDLGSRVLQSLLRVTLADPNAEARCLALAALAVNIIVQLTHLNAGPDSTVNRPVTFPLDEFVYLLGMMRFQDHSVALVAVDMIHVLSNYCDIILRFNPTLTVCILRTLIWSLSYLWVSIDVEKIIPVEKRLLTSFILAITDWTIRLPPHVVRTRIQTSEKTEVENETLISAILNVFYLIICTSPTGVLVESKEPSMSLLKLLSMQPPDPLLDLLHQCETRPDIESFLVPTSRLDTSSLTIRTFLMANHGHPWTGFQQLGEGGLQAVYSVRLAARVSLCHLLNHLDHYPMDGQGAQLNTTIQETHDQAHGLPDADMSDATELSLTTLEQPNIQLFSLNESILLTFLSLPMPNTAPVTSRRASGEPQFHRFPISTRSLSMKPFLLDPPENSSHFEGALAPTDNFIEVSDVQYTRIIVRDFAGKYSWDLSYLHGLWNGSDPGPTHMSPLGIESSSSTSRHAPPCPPPRLNPNPPPLQSSLVRSSGSPGSDPSDPSSTKSRTTRVLLSSSSNHTVISNQPKPDALDQLMKELSASSPECALEWNSNVQEDGVRRETGSPCFNMEAMTNDQITAQCQLDEEVLEHANRQFQSAAAAADDNSTGTRTGRTNANASISTSGVSPRNDSTSMPDQFAVCRNLINQLGFLSFERRPTIELVQKSAGLVRDLKHLDKFGVRETHKIAVFYVGAGQEDKQSILSNQTASLEFENFLAGLGWEIDLLTHRGFRGGLERSGRAGNSTPYYATATLEVIFHVSTRMPSSTQEDLKYKHLGNDEVMIIWTENARAFTRSVLRTQFGDVLIIISPLSTGLFRVDVRRESMVGFFGPIVHSAVLDACVLPGLVRATAINASRAIRAVNPGYRPHYEERAASLKQIISRYAVRSCFEDFAQSLVLPSLPPDSIISELLQQQPDGREILGGSFRMPVQESYPRQHPGHHQSLAAPFSFTSNVPQHVSSSRAAKSGSEQTNIDVDEHRSSPSSGRTEKRRHHHHNSSASARDGHTSSRRKHRSRSRRTSSKDAPRTARNQSPQHSAPEQRLSANLAPSLSGSSTANLGSPSASNLRHIFPSKSHR